MSGAVVGVGASRGCPPFELEALVEAGLAAAGVAPQQVDLLATVDVKGDEPAVLALAAALGWALRLFTASQLARVAVPTPSAAVARHVGTPSVAEAAALLAAGPGAELVLAKQRSAHATVAVALGHAHRRHHDASRDDSTTPSVVQSSFDGRGGGVGGIVYAATLDCKGCGACLKTCPERALRPAPAWFDGPPLLTLVDRCSGCGECLEICPADAFVALSPEEAPWPAA